MIELDFSLSALAVPVPRGEPAAALAVVAPCHQRLDEGLDEGAADGRDAAADPLVYETVEDAIVAGCELPCQFVDPDLFFAESPADVEVAKSLCGGCPVRAACLEGALARHEPWGVWGGEWFVAGIAVGRKRPRGRPRKDAAA